MKKMHVTRLLALGVAFCMTMSACGKSDGEQKDSDDKQESEQKQDEEKDVPDDEPGEIVEINILHGDSLEVGLVGGWAGKMFAEQGLKLNIIAAYDDVMNAYLTASDLEDVVIFGNYDQVNTAIEGNMLINLDDYADKLPMQMEGYTKEAIQYVRDERSNGTGNLYVVPGWVGPNVDSYSSSVLMLRWDVLTSLTDAPEVKTMEDLIPLLVAMKEANPQTESGLETYAFPLFSDWDEGIRFTPANIPMTMCGYTESTMRYMITIDRDGNIGNIFEEDGIYKRSLKWLYELNQNDLIDPDAMTMPWDTAMGRMADGAYLASGYGGYGTSYFNSEEKSEQGIGFAEFIFEDEVASVGHNASVGQAKLMTGISSTTDKLDACLKFVDLMADPMFQMELMNGPQGLYWDLDENGKAYATDAYFEKKDNDESLAVDEEGNTAGRPHLGYAFSESLWIEEIDNRMNKGYWDEVIEYNHENTLDKNWSEYYDGALSPVSVLKENDAYVNRSEAFFALPAMPDDINAIRTSVGDKYVTMSWKIIYAKDEAEFEELWKQMVDECYALGAQQVIDWATENVEANVELLEKYTQEFK